MMKQIPVLRTEILVWIMALFAIVGCSDGIDITETSELGTTGNAPKNRKRCSTPNQTGRGVLSPQYEFEKYWEDWEEVQRGGHLF